MGFVADFIGDLTGTNDQAKAAGKASNIQVEAAREGIAENRRQFDALQALQQPFVGAGTSAIGQQLALLGLSGGSAYQQAVDAIRNSAGFQAQLQQGENSILQNASATGGLRGGNTQAALAQYSPQMLGQAIQQRFANLGGLSSLGQNAAAGVGNAGMATGNSIASLLQQQGAAQAGGVLARGNADAQNKRDLLQLMTSAFTGGGF